MVFRSARGQLCLDDVVVWVSGEGGGGMTAWELVQLICRCHFPACRIGWRAGPNLFSQKNTRSAKHNSVNHKTLFLLVANSCFRAGDKIFLVAHLAESDHKNLFRQMLNFQEYS